MWGNSKLEAILRIIMGQEMTFQSFKFYSRCNYNLNEKNKTLKGSNNSLL